MTEMHLKREIKIKRRAFHALLITRITWQNLDGPSQIQQTQLNRNESKPIN